MARLIDQFETYNLKLQIQMNEEENPTSDILVNLGERIIATESILFVYNHLKLIQVKLPVNYFFLEKNLISKEIDSK